MRYFICDDNMIFAKDLEGKIQALEPECNIRLFSTLSALRFALGDKEEVDAVFLDIMNADGSGIEFAHIINKLKPLAKLVFVTSHAAEFSQEIFRCEPGNEPVAYLSKPVQEEYLKNALAKIHSSATRKQDFIPVTINRRTEYINCAELLYIVSDRRQLQFVSMGGDALSYGRMDDIMEKLPDFFCRCHRSYIINVRRIHRVKGWSSFEMSNGDVVPIGRFYQESTRNAVIAEYSRNGGFSVD